MSRIGKVPVALPDSVTASIEGSILSVKGPKGTLTMPMMDDISYGIEDDRIVRVLRREPDRLVTVACDVDREALLLEPAPDEVQHLLRVLDHQDPHVRPPSPASLRRVDEAAMKTSQVVRSRKLLTVAT